MKIRRIHLKSFQSIREKTTLQLAPITMLLGPNSAGKSSISDSLSTIAKLPKKLGTDWLSESVHRRSREDEMILGVGGPLYLSKLGDEKFDSWYRGYEAIESFFKNIGLEEYAAENFTLAVDEDPEISKLIFGEIFLNGEGAWSTNWNKEVDGAEMAPPELDVIFFYHQGYLNKIKILLDDSDFAELSSSKFNINVGHPKFEEKACLAGLKARLINDYQDFLDDMPEKIWRFQKLTNNDLIITGVIFPFSKEWLANGFVGYGRHNESDIYDALVASLSGEFSDENELHREAEECLGYFDEFRYETKPSIHKIVQWVIALIKIPAEIAVAASGYVLALGPLRDVPSDNDLAMIPEILDIDYVESGDPRSDWSRGRAAWFQLARKIELKELNEWLSAPNKLDMPYEFRKENWVLNHSKSTSDSVGPRLPTYPLDGRRFSSLHLWDRNIQQPVSVSNVGTGISQVVPALVAGLSGRDLIFVEQPELHLHPRLQSRLMDFFISRHDRDSVAILETHSEHMILRLLRRIRESSIADIRHRDFHIDCDEVAIHYFNPEDGETRVHRIRVDSSGRLVDRWPNGFFEERTEDLFFEPR